MLSRNAQRWLKGTHFVSGALCTGGLFSLMVFLRVKYILGDELDPLTTDLVLHNLFNRVFMIPLYAVVLTGLAYSVFTQWGFARYRWVMVKWLGAVILVTTSVLWMGPAVSGMAGLADGFFSIKGAAPLYGQLFRQAAWAMAASLALFILVIFISVMKPGSKAAVGRQGSPRAVRWACAFLILAAAAMFIAGSMSLDRYRSMEIGHVEPSLLPDGVYFGEATDGSFTYRVRVRLERGLMVDIRTDRNRDSLYARVAEGVFAKAINLQSPRADAITGATTTSKVLLKAVENALRQENR